MYFLHGGVTMKDDKSLVQFDFSEMVNALSMPDSVYDYLNHESDGAKALEEMSIKGTKEYCSLVIKELRDALGISRRKLAEITGLSINTLTNIENQRATLTYSNLFMANIRFNIYIEESDSQIVKNAFGLLMLGVIDVEDIFVEQTEQEDGSYEQLFNLGFGHSGSRFTHSISPFILQDIAKLDNEPLLNYEKEKLYSLYTNLSEIDQAKITERMEYIISTYESEDNIPTKRIAVLGQTACGNPIEAIEIADEFIETNELKATFALRAVGDSMSPLINDGDVILIKQTEELEVSDIGIFQINETGFSDDEEVTCKMLKSIKDGVMTLVPLNPSHDPIVVDSKKHQVKIIGKYIGRA